ncbi:MAG: hypothetical protein H0X51_09295 [Parachlamydiaceae bacterium]|nr:hypothetical protein [Parachlamydiaceae bacterium]
MKVYHRICLFLAILALPLMGFASDTVVRAAIDIGSGATKLKVAEINLKTQKIEKVLVNTSFPVQYQEGLAKSKDESFDETLMQIGLDALKKSKQIALEHKAENVVAVATASFRKASNVQVFIDRIYSETGIKVYIIDQKLEGILGFEATTAQFSSDPKDVIVWDIGGGSFQFSMLDEKGEMTVYRGVDASIPFKNEVIKHVKQQDPNEVTTPNPMTAQHIDHASEHARFLSKKVDQHFQEKIRDPKTKIVGIGNIFAYGIYPLVGKKSLFTQNDLFTNIKTLAGKTDQDLGGDDYVNVSVSNPILVLGFMQTLNIEQMHIIDINNADGALLYSAFWEKE